MNELALFAGAGGGILGGHLLGCPSERLRHAPDLVSVIKMRPLPDGTMPPQDGQLNPEWVEWFMGWPIGWTELKPLAMGKFHEWLQQHSPSLQKVEEAA